MPDNASMVPRGVMIPAVAAYGAAALLPSLYMLSAGASGAWRHGWLDTRQLGLLGNTVAMASLASAGAVVAGTALALLVGRSNVWGRPGLLLAVVGQLLIPPHILAIAWQQVWGDEFSGLAAAALVLALAYAPLVFLIALAGLSGVDARLEEAALLARSPGSVLRGMTLPMIRPHVLAAFVLVFLLCAVEYGVPDLLRLNTYPVEIFAQFSAFYDESAAAVLCAPLLLVTFGLVALMQKLIGERLFSPPRIPSRVPVAVADLRRARLGVSTLTWLIVGASAGVPVLRLAYQVLTSKRTVLSMLSGAPVVSSVLLAAASATFVVMLAFPIAYAAERAGRTVRNWILFLALLPIAVPATVVGIGLVRMWNRADALPVYGTELMLMLGYAARFSPFAVVVVFATMKQVSVEQEHAALLASGSWSRRVARIVLPQCRAGFAVAWTLMFTFCLGELGTSLLLMPPGSETMTLRLFNILHYGAHDVVSALSLVVVACGLAVSAVAFLVARGSHRRRLWST